MKVRLLLCAISLILFNSSFSQEAPVAVLEDGDVEKYAESVVPMTKEFKKLGLDMDGDPKNIGQEWAKDAEVKSVLEKYGWNEEFALKFSAITWAYTYLKIKTEIDKMPDDQKAQAEAMMPMFEMYINMVHDDDIKIVETKMDQLDAAFKGLEKL